MTELLIIALCAVLLCWQEWNHRQERREWRDERRALMLRAVPGLEIERVVVEKRPEDPEVVPGMEWQA